MAFNPINPFTRTRAREISRSGNASQIRPKTSSNPQALEWTGFKDLQRYVPVTVWTQSTDAALRLGVVLYKDEFFLNTYDENRFIYGSLIYIVNYTNGKIVDIEPLITD